KESAMTPRHRGVRPVVHHSPSTRSARREPGVRPASRPAPVTRAGAVEGLEPRRLFAVVTVTTTADDLTPNDGTVSRREALTAINAGNDLGDPSITTQNPGTFGTNDTINFNIPGTGVKTIGVTPAMPTITRLLTVNGYSQPGASVNTLANADNAVLLVELNG